MIEWLGTSHFSFLEGASSPESLSIAAAQLGYSGFALADRMNISGVVQALRGAEMVRGRVRAHCEGLAQDAGFFFAPGIRLHFDIADPLFIYPLHREAHARLCQFLSDWSLEGMIAREKGLTPLRWKDFKTFLRVSNANERSVAGDYVLISVSGRFYPWVSAPKTPNKDRVKTQDTRPPAPSFSVPPTTPGQTPFWLLELSEICGQGSRSALSLAYPINLAPGTEDLLDWLEEHAARLKIPLLATTLPLFAGKEDHDLCDLVTAIRHTRTVHTLGYLRQANGGRRLLSPFEREFCKKIIHERFQKSRMELNDPFERGFELAARHRFSLLELRYHYPRENIPPGETPSRYLERLAFEGARKRFPGGLTPAVEAQLRHELKLVATLGYEDYFLTIWDVLRYARDREILFQGRGSAANSVLCYCLEITAIDPVAMNLLFERFISLERREPPDIDVDFEHERREEVIQEVYRRYGRDRAAMVASYICFRDRMAARETAKALGISNAAIDEIATYMGREGMNRIKVFPTPKPLAEILIKHRVTPALWERFLDLAQRLEGTPRHLSIHTGGFVLSSEKLSEQCVIEPARMQDRSVLPWDKDDVDFLGWMKVDLLSLGMITALRKCFDLIGPRNVTGAKLSLATMPSEDPAVYLAMQRADTVGVFQIESRAQMNMLPRLAPKEFYDIVIEVAIVRPGPLQGGMVHPYIRRRQGLEPVAYDHPDLEPILKKTHGIPIFQEQVMKIAVAVAGFSPGEADRLRKVMSGAWRSKSHMREIRERLLKGMGEKGIKSDLAERLYKQIEGFGEYGFPESHAASFAKLTYASTWLKVHHPSEFLCALLNAQPMGFYSARSLVSDAERHGVNALPVDIFSSTWDHALEFNPNDESKPFVRLGMRLVPGLSRAEAELVEALQRKGILSPEREAPRVKDLFESGLAVKTLETLIHANACRGLREVAAQKHSDPTRGSSDAAHGSNDPRRRQLWQTLELKNRTFTQPTLGLTSQSTGDGTFIPSMDEWASLLRDFQTVGLTPGRHPTTYARENFFKGMRPWRRAEDLYALKEKTRCFVVGLLSIKQRPPTAKGLTFLTLEDETGFMNLVLYAEVYERCRLIIERSPMLAAEVTVQRSLPAVASDPRTIALSLQTLELWNPFLKRSGDSCEGIRFKPRHYH